MYRLPLQSPIYKIICFLYTSKLKSMFSNHAKGTFKYNLKPDTGILPFLECSNGIHKNGVNIIAASFMTVIVFTYLNRNLFYRNYMRNKAI